MQLNRLAVVAMALAACSKPAEKSPPPAVSAVTVALPPAPSAPPSASPAPDNLYVASVAIFRKDTLVGCIDGAFVTERMADILAKLSEKKTPMTAEALIDDDLKGFVNGAKTVVGDALNDAYGKGTAEKLQPRGEPQSIPKPCGEQFASRLVTSSCVVAAGSKVRIGLDIRSYEALATDDRAMRGCLAAKGAWQEAPKDSAAFLRERRQQLFRMLEAQ